ncbi:MAG: ACP S-malonyltransferase [Magnetococcales bacterium]|nr:ACP S-malonyltransferase [Magnetococcales bacterium]
MAKTAFLFPGQGAQAVGMGQVLAEADGGVRELIQEADRVLGFSLGSLMFEGPADKLNLTENTQPALVTTALAACHLLMERSKLRPDYVAGHSLGEYAAISVAGGFSFADAVRLVRLRGQAMQEAVPVGVGGMAAMLNMSQEDVEAVCRDAAQESGQVCVPANFNTSAQIVISGHQEAVNRAVALAKERGAKRCVPLAVSAPFHSPLMEPAAKRMDEALKETGIKDLNIPLIANVTASEVTDGNEVRRLLVEQITGAVRWEASIHQLLTLGVDLFVEVGTGRVLSGMMKRIDRKARVVTINAPEDIDKLEGI